MPEIKKEAENLEIITINVDKNKEDWFKNYIINNITCTSIYNKNGKYSDVFTKYNVFITAAYYIFDKSGNLIEK
ncbi:TlpA family protein disulfide reductase [Polaribacter glomeratus]|uniref:Uncharacterized protein n=1 Tax=Polaribacter glomeratus TaxID=102 RepID=A0A2S7WXS9_9FLAO|nr:hypothetical protein [Polaribacter glomeratus]PQJ82296.1 hypothetical protein BTO16_06770 [Polaribacter glomeratus]TXD66890.1 hypothetical protein ESX12_05080 [Polaribacter glomeratus]